MCSVLSQSLYCDSLYYFSVHVVRNSVCDNLKDLSGDFRTLVIFNFSVSRNRIQV